LTEDPRPVELVSQDETTPESRPALSQPGEFPEPWLRHRPAPERYQRGSKMVAPGMLGGLLVVAVVAWGVLLQPHRSEIAALVGELNKLALGDKTPDVQQPFEDTTQKSTRRPRKVRGMPTESPGPLALTPSPASEVSALPQQPNPPQLQVQEHDNQRRTVELRSGPVVRLRDWGAEGQITLSGELPEQRELPTYPALALRDRVQGTVVLRALVGRKGRVENVQVLSGPSLLASAAVEPVRRWRYPPADPNAEPVGAWKQITFEFTIYSK